MRLCKGLVASLLLCPAAVLLAAAGLPGRSSAVQKQNRRVMSVPLPPDCGAEQAELRLDGVLPADIDDGIRREDPSLVQRAANIFSWREFLALNWPAEQGERGEAALALPIEAAGPRLWETWKETAEVYRPSGAEPDAWGAPPPQHNDRHSAARAEVAPMCIS